MYAGLRSRLEEGLSVKLDRAKSLTGQWYELALSFVNWSRQTWEVFVWYGLLLFGRAHNLLREVKTCIALKNYSEARYSGPVICTFRFNNFYPFRSLLLTLASCMLIYPSEEGSSNTKYFISFLHNFTFAQVASYTLWTTSNSSTCTMRGVSGV